MSGGGSSRVGNIGAGHAEDCSNLKITTKLFSPAPLIISTLRDGDILAVKYDPPKGPVTIITTDGQIAGTIIHKDILKLINCIERGYEYRAIVESINGGSCSVMIKR